MNINLFVIHSIVIVGTFSILHLDTEISRPTSNLVSPFNVNDLVQNQNFSLKLVQKLFTEFENENKMKIEDEVIADIYTLTNGHAGLVCLCGRAIEYNLISSLKDDRILSYRTWERFKLNSLMDEIAQYSTFRRMIKSLTNNNAKIAVTFFRDYFLLDDVEHKVENIVDIVSAEFLASEGVLIPVTSTRSSFRLSSLMVRNLILQRVIPMVFLYCPNQDIPLRSSGMLDVIDVLKLAIKSFDRNVIKNAPFRSFKTAKVRVNNAINQFVPRESVYDSELYRVLFNWLNMFNYQITGQWHLIYSNDKKNKHSYSDIVVKSPYGHVFVLELLATATKSELTEHYDWVLDYAKMLSANESWVVHFTREDNYDSKPHWPSDKLLKTGRLYVMHLWHNKYFDQLIMVARWWNHYRDESKTYMYRL